MEWNIEKGHTKDHENGNWKWNATCSLHLELLRNSHFFFSNHQVLCHSGVEKRRKEGRVERDLGLSDTFWLVNVYALIPFAYIKSLASVEWIWPRLGKKTWFYYLPVPKHSLLFLNDGLFLWEAITVPAVSVHGLTKRQYSRGLKA